jgi:hypothetical protein
MVRLVMNYVVMSENFKGFYDAGHGIKEFDVVEFFFSTIFQRLESGGPVRRHVSFKHYLLRHGAKGWSVTVRSGDLVHLPLAIRWGFHGYLRFPAYNTEAFYGCKFAIESPRDPQMMDRPWESS